MDESRASITLQQLQQVTYEHGSPFQLQANGQAIYCQQLIRVVPGKRLVFMGGFNNQTCANEKVIIKLFVHPSRAKKHWLREYDGAKLLSDNDIPTPDIIAQGISDEGIYFLIFRYVQGQNLAEFWQANKHSDRVQKLETMLTVLERHHRSGLAHQDVHYANFYLSDDGIVYTLDGEEIKASSAPLTKPRRLKNLALFLAQTFDLSKRTCLSLLKNYNHLASLDTTAEDGEQFWRLIKTYHQQRISQYLKKIVRECTEVIYQKTLNGYILCRRNYHNNELQKLLTQPELFFQDENSEYLKQGNTCTVKSVLVNNERYVIKRYNPKGIAYELTHKGKISRARKSWINAHLLRFMGISTPEPIALIEQQPAFGKRCSYFISQYSEGQNSWDFFCDKSNSDADKQLLADELLATLKQLCDNNISHGDLKGSNFLVNNNKLWLLDLDALTQHKNHWHFRKNWRRDKQRFLKNWDKKACYEPWKRYFNQALADETSGS